MNPTNGMIAGVYNGWIAHRNSNGYPMGGERDPDNVLANTVMHAHRLKFPVSIGQPGTTFERAIRRGAQRVRGSRRLGPSDIGEFPLVLDGFDEVLDGYARAYTPDTTTNTGAVITAPNALLSDPPRFILGLSVGLTGEDGVDYYDTYIWNNIQLTKPLGEGSSQSGGENPNPNEYTVSAEVSARTGTGLLYEDTNLNVIEDNDLFIRIRARWEYTLTTWKANGSATTFTLGYRPKSNDATGEAGNFITKNGVIAPVTSVSTSTGVVTLTAAGSSGDLWVVAYPTAYRPI